MPKPLTVWISTNCGYEDDTTLVEESEEELKGLLRKVKEEAALTLNIHWITEKVREFQKNIYFCFIDYIEAFDCVNHNKVENS